MNKPLTEKEKIQRNILRRISDANRDSSVRGIKIQPHELDVFSELQHQKDIDDCISMGEDTYIVNVITSSGKKLLKELEGRSK